MIWRRRHLDSFDGLAMSSLAVVNVWGQVLRAGESFQVRETEVAGRIKTTQKKRKGQK